MRILTRYILREVISHAAIGMAVFTFVLFTRDLGQILELVVRNSAPLPSVAEVFFFTFRSRSPITIPDGRAGRNSDRAQPSCRRQRNHGHARQRHRRLDLPAGRFHLCRRGLAAGSGQRSVSRARSPKRRWTHLQDRLKTSQVSFEVQPRVFYEGFPGLVLYVQNVKAAQGAAIWKGVFIADISTPGSPRITLARQGILVSEGPTRLHLHLTDGSTHETDPENPRPLPDFHLRADRYPDSTCRRPTARKSRNRVPVVANGNLRTCASRRASKKSNPRPLVPDRVPSPLRAAHLVPGVGAGRNSPRPVVEKRRQVRRIRARHPAGVRLLLRVADRSFTGAPGKVIARLRGLAGGHRFLPGRRISAVARRTPAI